MEFSPNLASSEVCSSSAVVVHIYSVCNCRVPRVLLGQLDPPVCCADAVLDHYVTQTFKVVTKEYGHTSYGYISYWCQMMPMGSCSPNLVKAGSPHPNLAAHFQGCQRTSQTLQWEALYQAEKAQKTFSAVAPSRTPLGELPMHKYLKYLFIIIIFPLPWLVGKRKPSAHSPRSP